MLKQLVEVVGFTEEEFRPLNGKRGKVVSAEGPAHYNVETFDGLRITVPKPNVKEFFPDAPEKGGFHVAWPRGPETGADVEGAADFAAHVAQALQSEAYCVIQMFMSDEDRERAYEDALPSNIRFKRMKKEFERSYLGREHACKTAWMDGVADTSEELTSALELCDGYISNFTELISPLAPYALNFNAYSRTSAMVRVPLSGAADEQQLQSTDVTDEDIEDGAVDNHIQFLKRRQLCVIMVVKSQGGTLTLIPKDDEKNQITLQLSQGQMIVFKTNSISFKYSPTGKRDMAMQAWVLSEPEQLDFKCLEGDQQSKDSAIGLLKGPNTPEGNRVNVVGMSVGFGGGANVSNDTWWCAPVAGTDSITKVPFARWDMDVYYKPENVWVPGFTYTVHGGFVTEDIYAIDNKFFDVPEEEAYIMSPGQKHFLEKGYDALYRSQYTRETLKGKKIGVFLGHSGDDYNMSPQNTLGGHDACKHGYHARVWSTLASRIAYIFGMKGPMTVLDTACSSALCAYGIGHAMLRPRLSTQGVGVSGNQLEQGLFGGVNMLAGVGGFIGCCGPHMLSSLGRCFTFNHSADGYLRGEGTGALVATCKIENYEGLGIATVIGSCLNQDGRSASMTAPNGPAQQKCITASMKEAGLHANEVTQAELHGTGTALGDPIEVGALRGVMDDRVIPLMQASAKSHIGHLEATAGQAGLQKSILMCSAACGTPNCHLTCMNPHLDVSGYPTIFNTELVDYGSNSGYSGVSSFGFGGANARGDVFATAKRGPRRTGALDLSEVDYITMTCPFDQGPMHYLDGRAVPQDTTKAYRRGRYHADAIRDEFATYDYSSHVYNGKYQLDSKESWEEHDDPPDGPIYITGTWDAFREPREMDKGDDNTYTFMFVLSETRWERFQLCVDKNPYQKIYPVAMNGSMQTRVMGPAPGGDDLYWIIDGRDTEVLAGTEYRISLKWAETLSVSWEQVSSPEPAPTKDFMKAWGFEAANKPKMGTTRSGAVFGQHKYCIVGSWTAWKPLDMRDVSKDEEEENTWVADVRIGMAGFENFRFVRDGDLNQVIYPAKDEGDDSVPVRGPDELCNDKSFKITGKNNEPVRIRLQIIDGHITMSTISKSQRTVAYESIEGPARHTYCVAGSFNNWNYEEMQADETRPGVYTLPVVIGSSLETFFKVVVDEDPDLVLSPEDIYAAPGASIVRGPGKPSGPDGGYWHVRCLRPGAVFEVIVDRYAADKRRVVDYRWTTESVDLDSMRATVYNAIVFPDYAA